MIVYVVNIIDYANHGPEVRGVYSNLALAGRAAMQYINGIMEEDGITVTFHRDEEPWGYFLDLNARGYDDSWQLGEIEIIRVTVNE